MFEDNTHMRHYYNITNNSFKSKCNDLDDENAIETCCYAQRATTRVNKASLIYINDLDDSITSNILKFADDTKVFRKVNNDGEK